MTTRYGEGEPYAKTRRQDGRGDRRGGGIGGVPAVVSPMKARVWRCSSQSRAAEKVAVATARRAGKPRRSAGTSPTAPRRCRGDGTEETLGPDRRAGEHAGWDVFKLFTETEPVHWDKLIADQSDRCAAHDSRLLPGMAARKKGRIVNMRPTGHGSGPPASGCTRPAKGGLVAFSKTIAREHARHGSRSTWSVRVRPTPHSSRIQGGAGNPEAGGGLHPGRSAGSHRHPTTSPARLSSSPVTTPRSSPDRC